MYAFSRCIEIPWGFKTVYPYYYIGYIIASSKFQVKNYVMRKILIFFSIFGVLLLSWMRYDIGEINPTIDKFTHVLLPIPIIYLIHIFFKSFLNNEIPFFSDVTLFILTASNVFSFLSSLLSLKGSFLV